jgi:transglutaminase-like putative cysteine protease
MRRLHIFHTTTYAYSQAVDLLPHTMLVRPREGHDVWIESAQLTMTPAATVQWHRDTYDNSVAVASFAEPTTVLSIQSDVTLQHFDAQPLNFVVPESAVNFPFSYHPTERMDLFPYTMPVFPTDYESVGDWVSEFWSPSQVVETYGLLDMLNTAIHQRFTYTVREEPGVQSPATTLLHQRGSCRDFATLFIAACRYLGLAARFVSGYLHCPETEAGHGSTHAWAELYLPGVGWKGFDSTSGEVVGNDHIAVAVHRRPEAVPPVTGAFVGQLSQPATMQVGVQVTEIN